MRPKKPYERIGRGAEGFSFIELLMAMVILGILAGISISNWSAYLKRAEFTALEADLDLFMDTQDAYYTLNDKFYPDRGRVNIRSGVAKEIPELGFTFRQGHKHRFRIYGTNKINRRNQAVNQYIIMVFADTDYNGNGRNDKFQYRTKIKNGQFRYQRQFRQFR